MIGRRASRTGGLGEDETERPLDVEEAVEEPDREVDVVVDEQHVVVARRRRPREQRTEDLVLRGERRPSLGDEAIGQHRRPAQPAAAGSPDHGPALVDVDVPRRRQLGSRRGPPSSPDRRARRRRRAPAAAPTGARRPAAPVPRSPVAAASAACRVRRAGSDPAARLAHSTSCEAPEDVDVARQRAIVERRYSSMSVERVLGERRCGRLRRRGRRRDRRRTWGRRRCHAPGAPSTAHSAPTRPDGSRRARRTISGPSAASSSHSASRSHGPRRRAPCVRPVPHVDAGEVEAQTELDIGEAFERRVEHAAPREERALHRELAGAQVHDVRGRRSGVVGVAERDVVGCDGPHGER